MFLQHKLFYILFSLQITILQNEVHFILFSLSILLPQIPYFARFSSHMFLQQKLCLISFSSHLLFVCFLFVFLKHTVLLFISSFSKTKAAFRTIFITHVSPKASSSSYRFQSNDAIGMLFVQPIFSSCLSSSCTLKLDKRRIYRNRNTRTLNFFLVTKKGYYVMSAQEGW